jgi:hypothetical protein
LLAHGLLASLLLNFNSAALHGNSDGVSSQELSAWGGVEKSDFSAKIGLLGRSPLNKFYLTSTAYSPLPAPHRLFPHSPIPLLPFSGSRL